MAARVRGGGGAGERGFTLLEALVALAILGAALAGVFRGLDLGLRTADAAERERAAVEAAENLLAELGRSRPLREGVTEGDLPGGRRWRLSVVPLRRDDLEATTAAEVVDRSPAVQGHWVELVVSWRHAGRAASLAVQTFRLGAAAE